MQYRSRRGGSPSLPARGVLLLVVLCGLSRCAVGGDVVELDALNYPHNCSQFEPVRASTRQAIATSAANSNVHTIVFQVALDGPALPDSLQQPFLANLTKWTWSKDPVYERSRLSMVCHAVPSGVVGCRAMGVRYGAWGGEKGRSATFCGCSEIA
jgi:hypothetical protein